MPVRYSDQSAGPSTRQAEGVATPEPRQTQAVTSSSQMTRAPLAALAKERGLPTSGSKADLISRLAGVDVS
jgi:hypothetical protein